MKNERKQKLISLLYDCLAESTLQYYKSTFDLFNLAHNECPPFLYYLIDVLIWIPLLWNVYYFYVIFFIPVLDNRSCARGSGLVSSCVSRGFHWGLGWQVKMDNHFSISHPCFSAIHNHLMLGGIIVCLTATALLQCICSGSRPCNPICCLGLLALWPAHIQSRRPFRPVAHRLH